MCTIECECGYKQTFTFMVLHRLEAHHDEPADARAYAMTAQRKQDEALADVHRIH